MQTQEFKQLADESERVAGQHQLTHEGLFEQAVELMRLAAATGFDDKQALQASLSAFQRMIPHARQDARPFLFSGYLLWLMDCRDEAETHIKQAGRISPDEPDVAVLLELIAREREQLCFRSWDPSLPRQEQQIDLEALYNELTGHVQTRLRQLMQLPQPDQQVLEGADLLRVQAVLGDLESFLATCCQALAILGESFTPAKLDALMQPLLAQQALLQQHRESSEAIVRLRRRIGTATKAADQLGKDARKLRGAEEFLAAGTALDKLCDDCDGYADQLDALAAAGHDIALLEKGYERLLRFVSQAQQILDARRPLPARAAGH